MRLCIVDAFTKRPFAGNPAAVCELSHEADPQWMQSVAAEMNLSETAFVRPIDDDFELRWFTPKLEVDLCGHATLAAAHALWNEWGRASDRPIRFRTRSGLLTCVPSGSMIELDFPALPVTAAQPPDGLCEAMGVQPVYVGRSTFDKLILVESEATLRALRPDFERMRGLPMRGVMVTSASRDPAFDFVSRYFAPGAGINEDPVTGSAHCCLGPFWGDRLRKQSLVGYQASARGGVVHIDLRGDRVALRGHATTVVRGELV
jgi:predicted PhzF superfamily epimerase YddE/YHI9